MKLRDMLMATGEYESQDQVDRLIAEEKLQDFNAEKARR